MGGKIETAVRGGSRRSRLRRRAVSVADASTGPAADSTGLVYDDPTAALDERTLRLLSARRSSAFRDRGWLIRRLLMVADLVGLGVAFFLAQAALGFSTGASDGVAFGAEALLFFATLPVWVVLAKLYGLYDKDEKHTNHSTVDDLIDVFHMVTIGTWLLFIGSWLGHGSDLNLPWYVAFWALSMVAVTLARVGARSVARRNISYLQNTIIVGAGDVGQLLARKLLQHPEYGINLVGFVDTAPKERRHDLQHLTVLGPPERLTALVKLLDIERVIIAFTNDSHEDTLKLIRSLSDLRVQIDIVPRLYEIISAGFGIRTIEGMPMVAVPSFALSRSSRALKRAMDLTFTLLGLVALAPLFAAVAIMIKLDSRGPVFFRQLRMGGGHRTFSIYKFRTMVEDADARKSEFAHLNKHAQHGGDPRMFKIPGDPRVTRLGAFLRRHSLDELPQLLNVLKGEMSLVGPRPLILEEDQHVPAWARRRLDLKPGITGVWQVLGSTFIPFDEMVKLDYLYVSAWSLWNDLALILKSIRVLGGHREFA